MRKILSILCLLITLTQLQAQDFKRFTVSLSYLSADASVGKDDNNVEKKLLPSIAYNFTPWLSAGLEANLPLRDNGVYSSTGGEVFVSFHSPSVKRFRLSLSTVFGYNIVGAYKHYKNLKAYTFFAPLGGLPDGYESPTPLKERWHIGLRPTLSYFISPSLAINVSFGFLGYRSHKQLNNNIVLHDNIDFHKKIERITGAWGFTASPTYSSSLRLGLSYSF